MSLSDYERRLVRIGAICGLIGAALYIAVGLADQFIDWGRGASFLEEMGDPLSARFNMGIHFVLSAAFLLWLVSFLGLSHSLGVGRHRLSVAIATVFGIVSCGIATIMLMVQGTVMVKVAEMYGDAGSDAQREGIETLYHGLRFVDQGMDLAFDLFLFAAWIILAFAMLHHEAYGKVLGFIGLALFISDIPIQLYHAPNPPPFDVGPFAAFWLLAVFVKMLRSTGVRAQTS